MKPNAQDEVEGKFPRLERESEEESGVTEE
jgi:hypothetical protein